MPSHRRNPWHLFKALTSGLSLTLIIFCAAGIMDILARFYDILIPGGYHKVPWLTQWLLPLPDQSLIQGIAFLLLLAGLTWLTAQSNEPVMATIQRMIFALVALGVFAAMVPFRSVVQILDQNPSFAWSDFLNESSWLIPCAIPLTLALIKHGRSVHIS